MKIMKILVIDDDENIRIIMTKFLELLNCQVDAVENGEKGLKLISKAKNNNSEYELVFTDRNMPGILGEEVVRRIKRDYPDTKVILMSGEINESIKRVVFSAGADGIIEKPFSLEEIENCINEINRIG